MPCLSFRSSNANLSEGGRHSGELTYKLWRIYWNIIAEKGEIVNYSRITNHESRIKEN